MNPDEDYPPRKWDALDWGEAVCILAIVVLLYFLATTA